MEPNHDLNGARRRDRRMRHLILALTLGALVLAAPAQASVTPPVVTSALVLTPSGYLPPTTATVIPATATYEPAGTVMQGAKCDPWPAGVECEHVDMPNDGVSVDITFDQPTAQDLWLTAKGGWSAVGYPTRVPAGTTEFKGVLPHITIFNANYEIDLWQAAAGCDTGVPSIAIAYPGLCGVQLVLSTDTDYENNAIEEIGTPFTVAAYAPDASVTGDPVLHFRPVFRANSKIIFKHHGRIVREIELDWLRPGPHRTEFGCGKLKKGTYSVHVRGVAHDGATQNSPTRKVRCE
jgi:hypothetical protein